MRPVNGDRVRTSSLWASFGHAWHGLVDAAVGERNMRIHLVAGVLAGAFATAAPLATVERALILLCIAVVIAAEAANTALESLVDLHGGAPSEPARIAKDAAAGAVLVLAVASVLVFALVVAGRWRQLFDGWRALILPGASGLGLAALAALLPLPARPLGRAATPLAVAGVIPVTILARGSACPPCALVPAILVGVALGAAMRRQQGVSGGSRTTVGV
jgi:diacylglycerol kinase (ATP)